MSQLNQIVASLLRDINQAKSQVDYDTRELARAYAADDVLKYFSVPRIGIQNLDVELKYAVEAVEEQPFQSVQSQEKLAALMKSFARETSKAVQAEVTKAVAVSPLYKGLTGGYPNVEWQNSLTNTLNDELMAATSNPAALSAAISVAEKKITAQMSTLVPAAKTVSVFSIVPTLKGAFQLVSLDENGETDFEVQDIYDDESTAIADSKALAAALKANQAILKNFSRNETKKAETATVTIGTKSLQVLVPSQQIIANKEIFFKDKLGLKTKLINNPIKKPSWLTGRVATVVTTNAPPNTTEEADDSLKKMATETLRQKFLQLQTTVSKLATETKTTSLKVMIEAEKLKAVKPENLLTLKFSLNAQNFTVFDNDEQTAIV